MTTHVQLGSVEFNTGALDADGLEWFCQIPIGGWLSAPPRLSLLDRTADDGQVQAGARYGPRALTLVGAIDYAHSTWQTAMDRLEALSELVTADTTLVVEEPVPKRIQVIRNAVMQPGSGTKTMFPFQIPLVALLPTKLSDTEHAQPLTVGAANVIHNAGNYPTFARILRVNAGSSFSITNVTDGNLAVVYSQSTTGGDVLELDGDPAARTVELNGTNVYGYARGTTWFRVQPGDNHLTVVATTLGAVTVFWRDGWM